MNHAILGTVSLIVVFALVMINSAPIVHAQSTFPVPPPPTSQIIQQPGTTFAQPCVNNGTNVIESGKQILNQENQCNGTRVTQPPTSNGQPIANAGPSQTVPSASIVTLDGTASFAQNGAAITSFLWNQISGPAVALTQATTARPTFTAPTVNSPTTTTVSFNLVVTDSNGLVSAPSSVTITVTPQL